MKVFVLKRKFIDLAILLMVCLFVVFALGYWIGLNQRGVIVEKGETEALGLAPMTQIQEDVVLLDLNRATAEELTSLPGVGEKLAETIVKFREKHGDFQSVWELTAIEGIGEKKLDSMLPYLKVE